jgi:hypothetical protein
MCRIMVALCTASESGVPVTGCGYGFLGDEADICGTVCSWRPCGNNKTMPGIGIKLDAELDDG